MAVKEIVQDKAIPLNYEGVVNLIAALYPELSSGYQQVARFFTQNPNVIALESINAIAAKCGVHPSSLVRFAQNLGYSGFKELQAVFQTRLATAAPGFRERINALENELSRKGGHGTRGFLKDLVVRDIAALQGLLENVSEEQLSKTAKLLANAQTIYIAGQLRSEPIALLLRYLLTMLQRKVILLDPAGGLANEMALTMGEKDALVAIAFRHYAKEVVSIAEQAVNLGVPVISITDSQLSPLAKRAGVLFTVPEDEYTFSRSLAAPMCLVQCIATATAALLRPSKAEAPPRIPSVTEIARDRSARLPREASRK
ncbi:MAG: MurR/RpiR family transcriptional regulator [Rhizobiales bacterium]|nr:MurR/RpiR family transcriptional regulator [Hyphomicrobiales bacterium]